MPKTIAMVGVTTAGRAWLALLVLAMALATSASIEATALTGRVIAVHDGDTITVLAQRREVRVRLAGIDAPERGQPFASASRRALAERVAGRDAIVGVQGRDRYGRTLGVVLVAGVDVNHAQVADGWAWVFRRFTDDARLIAAEATARGERRGLWRDAHPVAPWAWRERRGAPVSVAVH